MEFLHTLTVSKKIKMDIMIEITKKYAVRHVTCIKQLINA